MEMRGRNRKWLGTGNRRRAVGVGWVNIVHEFCPRVCSRWRGMNAFVIIDIIEHCVKVGHHECVGGENRGGSRRGSVDRKERAGCGELAANFFFLNVEEASNMLDHLFVRESYLAIGGAVRRRRGDKIRGVASAAGRRRGARWNEDGRRQARHCLNGWTVMWCVKGKELICVVDTDRAVNWRGLCEVLESQSEVGMRII